MWGDFPKINGIKKRVSQLYRCTRCFLEKVQLTVTISLYGACFRIPGSLVFLYGSSYRYRPPIHSTRAVPFYESSYCLAKYDTHPGFRSLFLVPVDSIGGNPGTERTEDLSVWLDLLRLPVGGRPFGPSVSNLTNCAGEGRKVCTQFYVCMWMPLLF